MESLLDRIRLPEQIRQLNQDERLQLAQEVRDLIIRTVSKNGGHLSSNLGVVELTMALLIEFDFHRDQIIFDVGHQSYAWKILTGRRDQFRLLRKKNGLSGFPRQDESPYDFFNTGHSSTSISAALGISRAMARVGRAGHVIALIGDGALTGGMSFEALNDAGQSGENLIVILNDNQMSIGRNVGGLSRHLENLRISPQYIKIKSRLEAVLQKIPLVGKPVNQLINYIKTVARLAIQNRGIFFEQLGFKYYGPIDGHDLPGLLHHLKAIQELRGPVLLHVLTQKGKGYRYAEESPDIYHGVAPFIIENGIGNGSGYPASQENTTGQVSFSRFFGKQLVEMAERDTRICAISAAMTSGTGLMEYASLYPGRFFDVGIAEQHAVTLAAGLAAGGMKPFVAIYSTFLQRAFDQLLHDICLQNLPVVLMVDRAGIVGEDGDTHQGIYDLNILLPLPNLDIFCPPDYRSMAEAMNYALSAKSPVAIRYPRGREPDGHLPEHVHEEGVSSCPSILQVKCLRKGKDVTLAALGTLVAPALKAAALLSADDIEAEVLLISCAKPLDIDTIIRSVRKTGHILILEETATTGGLGQVTLPSILQAVPGARFLLHGISPCPVGLGSREQLLSSLGMKPEAIADFVKALIKD